MLISNSAAPERILAMGLWGSGKTHAWVTIAERYRATGTPGHFYVLDTDNTSARSLESTPGWEANVTRIDVWDWKDLTENTVKFFESATKDDWLIVDSIDKPWSLCQDYFIEMQFGVDATDFFVQARAANVKGHALASDYGSNWTVINKLYSKWIGQLIRFPGHVYVATPVQQINQGDQSGKGGDSREVKETFGRYGVRPAGQKNLGFQFHTVLLMQSPSKDEWTVTSVKDRSRELLIASPLFDFPMQYLCGIGGWQVTE